MAVVLLVVPFKIVILTCLLSIFCTFKCSYFPLESFSKSLCNLVPYPAASISAFISLLTLKFAVSVVVIRSIFASFCVPILYATRASGSFARGPFKMSAAQRCPSKVDTDKGRHSDSSAERAARYQKRAIKFVY